MNWWQAMITILLGNHRVDAGDAQHAHAGTRGVVSRLVPRVVRNGGADIPAILRTVVACGWFGIQTWIGGEALDALFGAMWKPWNGIGVHTWIAFFLFWGIQVYIIVQGVEGIKHLETWSAPLLLGGGAMLLAWASWKAGGLGRVLTASAALQRQHNAFWSIFPGALTASVGYWATLSLNIPDFTRYARSQRSQMVGQALGLPLTMTAFAFIGVAVTSATLLIYGRPIPNPVELMAHFDSILVIAFATAVIFAAQLTTNMAERRFAFQRFLEFESEDDFVCDGWPDHGCHRSPDDAVEADGLHGELHLHLAHRLLRFDGRHCRNTDLRLLGLAQATFGTGRAL
jgi:NCS1 family nucleobase:cation symporter-1